jgi:hypothetical protein
MSGTVHIVAGILLLVAAAVIVIRAVYFLQHGDDTTDRTVRRFTFSGTRGEWNARALVAFGIVWVVLVMAGIYLLVKA